MCGIVGFVSQDASAALTEQTLTHMRDQMVHRGPDDAGVHLQKDGDRTIGLGHRRLSIIDLSPLGHQPMSTADWRFWIRGGGEGRGPDPARGRRRSARPRDERFPSSPGRR